MTSGLGGIGSRSLNLNFLNLDVLGRIQDAIAGAVMPGHPPAPPLPDDPILQYRYLHGRRQTISDATRQRPLLRLWDKNHHFVGVLAREKSVRVEEIMADSGGGNVVIRHDNWLSNFILHDRRIEEDLHFTLDPIPSKPDWRTRWGGKVIGVNAKRSADGLHTVELEMVSNREHLKHILLGANPIFPPEVQLPKLFMLPWTCRTAISLSLFINLARTFFPLLSIPTNIFNPAAWIYSGAHAAGLDPLGWPIQCQFVNPLFDQSRFTILSSRWSDAHTVCAPLLEDAGAMIRAYTWLSTDDTSPHPELAANIAGINADKLARPHRNCIILAVEDKNSGTTGPTGCVAPETEIDSPDGTTRIDLLAKRGEPFKVWSLTPQGKKVHATAAYAFRKGREELHEYILANGSHIRATKDHRFLTRHGFQRAGDITIGTELATSHGDTVTYRPVIDIYSTGVGDYYDMHVPGWENYAAQGFWNHNTFIDGFLKLATKTADDLLTESIVPLLPGDIGRTSDYYEGSSNTIPFIQKLTMTAPERPHVVFRDGDYSGIVESQRSMHSPTARTVMTGGRSPGWVNACPVPAGQPAGVGIP